VRLDARGNKLGIQVTFSVENEQLAFSVHPEWGEIDDAHIWTKPHPQTLAALRMHTDALVLCASGLPDRL